MKTWIALLGAVAALAWTANADAQSRTHWAAAWAAAPQPSQVQATVVENVTVRQTVRLTLGGSRLVVRFSNEFGNGPLHIGGASVSVGGTTRNLTFSGHTAMVVPAGAPVLSDPVEIAAPRMAVATIDLYLPARTPLSTLHLVGLHPAKISARGDYVGHADFPTASTLGVRLFLTGVSVQTEEPAKVIAAMGASVVDGFRSTPGAYATWPDVLSQRLAGRNEAIGVVNLGIAGNMLVNDATGPAGVARFDRDVLSLPGITHVILLEGRNDLAALPGGQVAARVTGKGADAETLFAAYRQIAERAHQRGIKIIAANITPDTTAAWDEHKEAERRRLNGLLRSSRLFDGFIDFDPVVQNPSAPGLKPAYDSGDHLHPSDAGYRAMGESIDLRLFD